MKNIWKWILGILIFLAILAVPIVFHYTVGPRFAFGFDGRFPMMGDGGWSEMHRGWEGTHGFNRGFGMHSFGFFGPFMFLGGLAKLVLFGALLYGAYWLGRRNARLALDPAPGGPAVAPDEPEPAQVPKRGRKSAKGE
jgi:hypothetical protein